VQENSIYLEEDDPDAVALLIAFLYRGAISGSDRQCASAPSDRPKSFSNLRLPSQFAPTHEPNFFGASKGEQDVFQHICFQPFFSTLLPEEIRLDDYDYGDIGEKYGKEMPNTMSLFGSWYLENLCASYGKSTLLSSISHSSPAALADLSEPPMLAPTTVASTSLGNATPKFSGSGSFLRPSQTSNPPQANALFGTDASSLFRASNTTQTHFGNTASNSRSIFGHLATPTSSDFFASAGTLPRDPSTVGALSAFNAKQPFSGNKSVSSEGLFSGVGGLPESSSKNFASTGSTIGEINNPSPGLSTGQATTMEAAWRNALIHLLVLAEKVRFPAIFNAAIRAYVESGSRLSRPLLVEHAKLIYTSTNDKCTLRQMTMDYTSRMGADDRLNYMRLAQDNKQFVADIFSKVLAAKNTPFEESVGVLATKGAYDMAVPFQTATMKADIRGFQSGSGSAPS